MFYETAQTIGPGWHRSYKPTHYEDMTWSPSSKHFRSPGGSPQSYRRIIHPEDYEPSKDDDERFFSGRNSPTFSRKIFRDVWDDTPSSNHRFADRPRLFKRVFKPSRWEDDDDDNFERTRSTVRQIARDFDDDFDSRKLERDFDSEFHHRDRDLKSDIEEEFEKAAGKVHHIPIMVERRLDEMRSRFGRNSPTAEPNYQEDSGDWQGAQVQRIKKNFERDNDFSSLNRHRAPRSEINKPRSFTSPIPSRWDPEDVHTLPIRRSSKGSKLHEDSRTTTSPKSVFRSYSETHEDIPKQQQQHAAAFRSHSDGHCPKTTYVSKISVNIPPSESSHPVPNGDASEDYCDKAPENFCDSCEDGWDSHQSRQRTRRKPREEPNDFEDASKSAETDGQVKNEPKPGLVNKKNEERPAKENKRSSLQQIASVLQNVDDLIVHVEGYNGTCRDKQFRFLDEMLTRCMLRLDDVDTEGREDIRSARKAAVMQVQSCIEKLESKAYESERKKPVVNSQQEDAREKEHAPSENSNEENQSQLSQESNQPGKPEDDDEQTRL